MNRAVIYFIERPADRWFPGDHKLRKPIRRLLRGPDPIGGIKRVFLNLCEGLNRLGENYVVNIPFSQIRGDDRVGILGLGRQCLAGYSQSNPLLAGIAVAAHPAEWPTMFQDYPVSAYVVHSEWVKQMYERHYGSHIRTWAAGIDTHLWAPGREPAKSVDFLVYDKIRWDYERVHRAFVDPLLNTLRRRGMTYALLRYGDHRPEQYRAALARARAMLFLCEHETQGIAYQEALSCDVPVLAWDPGQWLDPWRFRYSEGFVPATSVPFFDQRCGMVFASLCEFDGVLDEFLTAIGRKVLHPQEYVLENLTLEACAQRYVNLLREYCS